jgi:hypothetical protein
MRNMLKITVSWDVTPEYSVASGLANCIPHGAALVYAYIEKTGGGGGVVLSKAPLFKKKTVFVLLLFIKFA